VRFLVNRGRMQAFIVIDYLSRANEAYVQIADWLEQRRLQYRVEIVPGLEQAPAALGKLFDGSNVGKLLVRIQREAPAASEPADGHERAR
jgi:NADPH-dependent curcumin reductase